MTEIIVKKVTTNEIMSIGYLIEGLGEYHDKISELNEFYPILSTSKIMKNLESEISSKSTFIFGAFYKDSVVGFIQYSIKVNIGSIDRLYVSSNNRNQGVGKKLMDAAMAVLENEQLNHIDLKVLVENSTAQSFYEKYGFKPRLTVMTKVN